MDVLLKVEDIHKAKLVETGWRFGQSYGGGYLAGQMVMAVLANRVRTGFCSSWFDVINRIPAFMAEKELPPLEFPSVWDGSFVKLLHIVEGVYEGAATDLSKGALYWADLNKIERPEFKARIIDPIKLDGPNAGERQHPLVANLNSLSFFR
jgi:hypothetical protein